MMFDFHTFNGHIFFQKSKQGNTFGLRITNLGPGSHIIHIATIIGLMLMPPLLSVS